jgi:hypothetical protein
LGEKLHTVIHEGINQYDRVVVICSRASLGRTGVLNEITEALAREAREGGITCLLPIRLDDYLLTDWNPRRPQIASALRDRVVGDFRGARTNSRKFDRGMTQLLAALKVSPDAKHHWIENT